TPTPSTPMNSPMLGLAWEKVPPDKSTIPELEAKRPTNRFLPRLTLPPVWLKRAWPLLATSRSRPMLTGVELLRLKDEPESIVRVPATTWNAPDTLTLPA